MFDHLILLSNRNRSALDGPVMPFFLAIMAFGYRMTGVGVTRVTWMLERTDGAEMRLGKIRDAARVSALQGWDALWDTSTRVKSLGTSFGTKLLHFSGYRQPRRGGR